MDLLQIAKITGNCSLQDTNLTLRLVYIGSAAKLPNANGMNRLAGNLKLLG